ncbi:ligase-associated DNA damage response endonuclease PdeM [Enterovirga aerilata]|uniref:Ligase-associated DNA damage response endonuclease PdeM n=1 Tax=Enterovirga aerilata TaxID=2730920 RepID=A0A849I3G8_9HYPH|nr:ligase-associated DNA damage response endonuclease PdeM [Enterovirga sp. DB1703]NNM70925.1 ligase-associated DNA damage response endonuclease PdeM [Enterovirga sp. DB1703]
MALPQKIAAAETEIAGLACLLDPSGAMFFTAEKALVVADLHLEKGSSYARRGSFLPPYDTRATIASLAGVIGRYLPRRVVALGDSFHDRRGPERLGEAERRALAEAMAGLDWIWITGNHDPDLRPEIGGEVLPETELGPLRLRHHPAAGACRELAGHLHPVAKVVLYGRSVRAKAFLSDGDRCVLPAFGAYAGGLNACDEVFGPLFPSGFTAHVIGRNRLFALAPAALCGD